MAARTLRGQLAVAEEAPRPLSITRETALALSARDDEREAKAVQGDPAQNERGPSRR